MGQLEFADFFCVSYERKVIKHPKSSSDLLIIETKLEIAYYDNLPTGDTTPTAHHLFLILANKVSCFQDKLLRSVIKYEQELNKTLSIYPGQIHIFNDDYEGFRFRESELEYALEIKKRLEDFGAKFMKSKKFTEQRTCISYKKQFNLVEFKPGIYKDNNAKNIFFIPLLADITRDDFKEIIKIIKNNCNLKHFEASLIYSILNNRTIGDFVMLYSPQCEIERLDDVKHTLNEEIKKRTSDNAF